MDEKIGINIKEASEILGISKQLMTELTKLNHRWLNGLIKIQEESLCRVWIYEDKDL